MNTTIRPAWATTNEIYDHNINVRRTELIRQMLDSGPQHFTLSTVITDPDEDVRDALCRADATEFAPFAAVLVNHPPCGSAGCVMGHALAVNWVHHPDERPHIVHTQKIFGLQDAICESVVRSDHPRVVDFERLTDAGLADNEAEWIVSILAIADLISGAIQSDDDAAANY